MQENRIGQSKGVVLAFDVGGTNIRGALADLRGEIIAEAQVPTVRYEGQGEYAEVYTGLRDRLLAEAGVKGGKVKAAVAAVAGIVEPGSERVLMAPNTSSVEDFYLRALMEDALGVPVAVENDVNLAAVGEHWKGAARDCEHFVFVAIGTGIGAGVFIDGRLYRGAHNAACELGYIFVHGAEKIGPGEPGALERRAAGPGLAEAARERLRRHGGGAESVLARMEPAEVTAEDVWAAALGGDRLAGEALEEALNTLALGLANVALLFDPELIVLGGGVAGVGEALAHPLRERLRGMLPHPVAPRLELSRLGSRAQLLGAVREALHNFES